MDFLIRLLHNLTLSYQNLSQLIGNASFTSDLGFDSLDHSELIMSIEETFDIDIADNDICELDSMDRSGSHIAR